MREKYLPIGTIVLLKGGKKRAMITGFCSVAQDNQDKIFDYSGCVYPEGYLSSNQVCLFDHDQIEKIFYLGYEDEEEKAFKTKLNQIVSQIEREHNADKIATTPSNTHPEILEVPSSGEVLTVPAGPTSTVSKPVPESFSMPSIATEEAGTSASGFVPFQ